MREDYDIWNCFHLGTILESVEQVSDDLIVTLKVDGGVQKQLSPFGKLLYGQDRLCVRIHSPTHFLLTIWGGNNYSDPVKIGELQLTLFGSEQEGQGVRIECFSDKKYGFIETQYSAADYHLPDGRPLTFAEIDYATRGYYRRMQKEFPADDLVSLDFLSLQSAVSKRINLLFMEMIATHLSHIIVRRSEGLPPLRCLQEWVDEWPDLKYDKVINRLKVMAGLDPVTYAQPREGQIAFSCGGTRFTTKALFADSEEDPYCEIVLAEE